MGLPNFTESLKREKLIIKWLDEIVIDAHEIYLLGDIFDFWHEWKRCAPQGHTRFIGKIANICDSGIKVHFFTGNHDIWVYKYLPQETGVILHRGNYELNINGIKILMGHGDGLGPGDRSYKLLKKMFTNKFLRWAFAKIHPDWALLFGQTWSRGGRTNYKIDKFRGIDKEYLVQYSLKELESKHYDFFIFGHRHVPSDIKIADNTRYINTGDWIVNFTYAVFDGNEMELKTYKQSD